MEHRAHIGLYSCSSEMESRSLIVRLHKEIPSKELIVQVKRQPDHEFCKPWSEAALTSARDIAVETPAETTNETPQIHDLEHLSEQLSPTTRFVLIISCLASGPSIASLQVLNSRNESIKLRDPPTRAAQILKMLRMILLNVIPGVLLMMATNTGAHEINLTSFEADFHSLLDPHLTQIKIDCFRSHAIHWVRYSPGWQVLENLARHAYNLHLWALTVE